MRKEPAQRRRPIPLVGRTVRLKVIDAKLLRGVHVPSRLRVERRNMTPRAFRVAVEDLPSSLRRGRIETPGGRPWNRQRQLIQLEISEFARDQVRVIPDVPESVLRRDGERCRVIQPRIEEIPLRSE